MKDSKITPRMNSGNKSIIQRLYSNCLVEFESMKWGYETIALFVQSCLGSIAAMFILKNTPLVNIKLVELVIVTILSMSYNAAVIIDLKVKSVFNILIASLFFSISMIIINLI